MIAEMEAAIVQLAKHMIEKNKRIQVDSLTGLGMRNYLESEGQKMLEIAKRDHNNLSVVVIDLDDLKKINDKYGHTAGDILLKEFAEILKNSIRKSDTACRLGGDEFVVLLPATNKEGAHDMMQKLSEKLENHTFVTNKGEEIKGIFASIGITTYPPENGTYQNDITFEKVFERADKEMYKNKKKRKGINYE